MRLTAIRLQGFKSFADNTVFPVDAPVTGIIGPNGCGKSNIIDAVRWVLGESAAKQLRGQTLTDVIFGGAKNRRAGGMATVSLHFDNSGNAAGAFAEYAEIVIQRRVTSDGQNFYQINNQRCRRKDVVELLQGTGVGARSYAVIEQGMVSRIVESKPEDLRAFVEEAAGIGVYKTRRKESERRMEQTREYLTRHDDRLRELAKQRARLGQEAETARLYREYQDEHSALSHRLASWQLLIINRQLNDLDTSYKNEENALKNAMTAVQKTEKELQAAQSASAAAESAWMQCETAYQTAVQQQQQYQAALGKSQTEAQHTAARITETASRLARFEAQLQEDDQETLHWQASLDEAKTAAALHAEHAAAAEHTVLEAQHTADAARAALDEAQRSHDRLYFRIERAEQNAQDALNRCGQLHQRLGREQEHQPEAEDSGAFDELALALETLEIEIENASAEIDSAQSALQQTQAQCDAANAAQQRLATAYTQLHSRFQTLADWLPQQTEHSEHGLPKLYEQLHVSSGWQQAIETLLGSHLQTAISHTPIDGAYTGLSPLPAQWQSILTTDADLNPLLGHLYPLPSSGRLEADKIYLTPAGEILTQNSRFIISASDSSGLLARIEEHHRLATELEALEAQLLDADTAAQTAKAAAAAARQNLQQIQNCRNQLEKQKSDTAHQLQLAKQQTAHRQLLAAQHAQNLQTLREDLASAEQQYQRAQTELAEAQRETAALPPLNGLKTAIQQADAALAQAQQTLRRHQTAQQEAERQTAALQTQIETQSRQQQRLTREIQDTRNQLSQAKDTAAKLEILLEEQAIAASASDDAASLAAENRTAAAAAKNEAQTALAEAKDRHYQAQNALQLGQERLNSRHQHLENLEMQQRTKIEELAADDRSPIKFAENETVDEAAVGKRIRRLKTAMENLGAVNHAAVEAYREADSEYQMLNEQCEDLRQTLAMLEDAIAQLDADTKERLSATFAAVNSHFSEYFPLLFRGGEGSLAWTDNDILNAGITLSVRPPGKKVKNLSVLSGGEKALTAVALVFSFFRLNPAPFCLLDEIDAPLDDANVGRLCTLLREMSAQTQFIMITHHKRSMQSCDRLIGVTMSEPGVSRLVSVKFDGMPETG